MSLTHQRALSPVVRRPWSGGVPPGSQVLKGVPVPRGLLGAFVLLLDRLSLRTLALPPGVTRSVSWEVSCPPACADVDPLHVKPGAG